MEEGWSFNEGRKPRSAGMERANWPRPGFLPPPGVMIATGSH